MQELLSTKNKLEKLLIDKKNNNLSPFELFNLVETANQKIEKVEYENNFKFENFQKQNVELTNEIVELKIEIFDVKKQCDDKIELNKNEITVVKNENQDLGQEVIELKQDINELKNQNNFLLDYVNKKIAEDEKQQKILAEIEEQKKTKKFK